MNMPRFTAEAAFYKTSGHYRTGRHRVNSPAQRVSPIWPAAMKGGDTGGGNGGGPPSPGGPGGTPESPPPKGSHECSAWVKQTDPFAAKCLAKGRGPHGVWQVLCGPAGGEMWCCFHDPDRGYGFCEHKLPPTASQ
jgi:hypothetical protein